MPLLYSCAIHIEVNSLRCFLAIRGTVHQIKSDQGTSFVGAKSEFKEALKEVNTDRLTAFQSEKQCDFNMNAPCSSHVMPGQ